MTSKTVIVRGREYKCRVVKIQLKLRDQQPKTITYIHIWIAIYKPPGDQNPKIYNRYTHTKEEGIQT